MRAKEDGLTFDVVVIGGGTAGMTAAKIVARTGKRVVLLEADRTGGDCLYTGCVPSKSLLAVAKVMERIRCGDQFGINVNPPTLDLGRAVQRKDRIVEQIGEADSPAVLRRAGITVIQGRARFCDSDEVEVGGQVVHGERFVIATGSRPARPPILGLAEVDYLTNVEALDLRVVPSRLAVIGAGPTGLELGQAFARFGSAVTIIERTDRVLSSDDGETSAILAKALEDDSIRLFLRTAVDNIKQSDGYKYLLLRQEGEDPNTIETDQVLVATGRQPEVDGLGLDVAGVQTGEHGIVVDAGLRTTARHVWACGDVIGPPYSTHVAEDQARTVAKNVLGGKARWSGRAVPWSTFTDPAVAGVGMTEAAARVALGRRLEVLRLHYDDIDRAVTDGAGDGLVKVLLAPGWTRGRLGGEVVGAHVVGAGAAEIVQQFAFLMAWHLPAGMLAKTVQAYPTYGLGGRQAVGLHWQRAKESRARPSFIEKLRGKLG